MASTDWFSRSALEMAAIAFAMVAFSQYSSWRVRRAEKRAELLNAMLQDSIRQLAFLLNSGHYAKPVRSSRTTTPYCPATRARADTA